MSKTRDDGRQLTRGQRRILLWMPLLGFWAVLLLISRNEDTGRDWVSVAMMGIVGGLVYVGVWLALLRITSKPAEPPQDATEQTPVSRASLIYGPRTKQPDRKPQDESEPPQDEPPTQP